MEMEAEEVMAYLKRHQLMLTTAESCTAGYTISLLAAAEGCGEHIESGYVVYSPEAKRRLLNVRQSTIDAIDACGLTSEEVAREMAAGALRDSTANVAIANTGIAGPDPVDGIPPGTVCFAWGFQHRDELILFSRTIRFPGDRAAVRRGAAEYSIDNLSHFHSKLLQGERG
jgi:nicotinamide-nucleotide amidase